MKHQNTLVQGLFSQRTQEPVSSLGITRLPFQILLTLIIFLFVYSCQEDTMKQTGLAKQDIDQHLQAWYQHKKNPETAITNRDGGGKLSVVDALDYLNLGMNFLYCRPHDNFLETVVFKDTFSIDVDGSHEVDEGDLTNMLDDIANFAGSRYYADARGTKEPLMFNMIEVGSPSPSYINIEASFAFGAGSPLETTDEYPYEDSWVYGQFGADVSEQCSDEHANADAADLFRRDLRTHVVFRSGDPYFFMNPYTVCFSPVSLNCFDVEIPEIYFLPDESYNEYDVINPEDVTENDNLFDYLLFFNYSNHSGFHTCLSSDEMNFHYESMAALANGILPSPAGNKVIAQIEVGYQLLAPELTTTIFHSMLVVKATKIPIEDEDYEEGLELPHP